jgi:hypothetical protein
MGEQDHYSHEGVGFLQSGPFFSKLSAETFCFLFLSSREGLDARSVSKNEYIYP